MDPGEECDENTASCSNCLEVKCGNGRVDPGEQCDNDGAYCSDSCQHVTCGNGVTDSGEECDGGANCYDECLKI